MFDDVQLSSSHFILLSLSVFTSPFFSYLGSTGCIMNTLSDEKLHPTSPRLFLNQFLRCFCFPAYLAPISPFYLCFVRLPLRLVLNSATTSLCIFLFRVYFNQKKLKKPKIKKKKIQVFTRIYSFDSIFSSWLFSCCREVTLFKGE